MARPFPTAFHVRTRCGLGGRGDDEWVATFCCAVDVWRPDDKTMHWANVRGRLGARAVQTSAV